jgi:major vault protein
MRRPGAYLPLADEEVVRTVQANVLTEKKALHLRAIRNHTDTAHKSPIERKAGEEWLVTLPIDLYIVDVYQELVGEVNIITLNNRQFCVVLDPVGKDGKQHFGRRELRVGECSFFLQPGERLENDRIQNVFVLGEDEALVLRAREDYVDKVPTKEGVKDVPRKPGALWMIHGPRDYFPPVQVEIVDKRKAIPLDKNEGIYIRDITTGAVRCEVGHSYLLNEHEVLWEKELPKEVEDLLLSGIDPLADRTVKAQKGSGGDKTRDKTRLVTYRVPHNAACQIYDYKNNKSRVIFGPDLALLQPDEQFTLLDLSGDKPKKANQIKSLVLLMGPDFMTDIVNVETSDHARLSLQLSYNWQFEVANRQDQKEAAKIFNIADFVGDACKAIASKVRGAVASVPFDLFHKSSAKLIRTSLFGLDANGSVKDRFEFGANGLVITSIDIQSVEPVDSKTRDALQKSVQLAIEITTKSQEASARHEAERSEQAAKGEIEKLMIIDKAEAEKANTELLRLKANSKKVEACGQAAAEAKAAAESAKIEAAARVSQAKHKAEAAEIESKAEVERLKRHQEAEIKHQQALNDLEIKRAEQLAAIEIEKFKNAVGAIGPDTIAAMAAAGPEMQAKLLGGLGLKGYLVTDGNSPINLFNTANGLLGGLGGK